MNKKGTIALEAVIASGLALMLLIVFTSLLVVYWQIWQENTQANRERQWAAMAFEYLCLDIREAHKVSATASSIQVTTADGNFEYKVSKDNASFHRGRGSSYYALALVDSVNWWWEGDLLWLELNFPNETYRSCFYIPEEKH